MNLISTSVALRCDLPPRCSHCSETRNKMESSMNFSLHLRNDYSARHMQGSWLPRSLNDVLLMVLCI